MTTTSLIKKQRAEIRTSLKEAIFHLCSCWDSLREAEEIFQENGLLMVEIETDDINVLAGSCCPAEDAYELSAKDLNALIDEKLETN